MKRSKQIEPEAVVALEPPPEVSAVIDRVLNRVEFTAPVTMADIKAVHDAMRADIPPSVKLETNGRIIAGEIAEVVIEARVGHSIICDRVKKVLREPPQGETER